jgi:hypothetical protein
VYNGGNLIVVYKVNFEQRSGNQNSTRAPQRCDARVLF